jgi:Secretion system C-terminal sorting domain
MKKVLLVLFACCSIILASAQLTITLPSNTVIITANGETQSDTGSFMNKNYLICPGIIVYESANVTSWANYYLETNATLLADTFNYTTYSLFMKPNSTFDANRNIMGTFPTIDTLIYQTPISLVDTVGAIMGFSFVQQTSLQFDYSLLSGGVGCPGTSINEVSIVNLTIFPNPATDGNIEISVSTDTDISYIKMTDLSGKIVYCKEYNSPVQKADPINISEWATGIYLITLQTNKGEFSRKLIKR